MISIVVYGRNDSYGYNMHKRVALSLNCMAQVLTNPDDEILFVDYNTPDDFPTLPEAIQDTLTTRAKACLRILRARPSVHRRFETKTHLKALEPISRNIAIRRANPGNSWILSTNTDAIFVMRGARSLSEIAGSLAPGLYGAPRVEIPEALWETLDRLDPEGTIDAVADWGWSLHLNEIVYSIDQALFDNPGDFQLFRRDDAVAMNGFDERMLLGWACDSNLGQRFRLKYGSIGDLSGDVFAYHCEHTRQVTPAHVQNLVQNDFDTYVASVERTDVASQAASWGCPDDLIEDFTLLRSPTSGYERAVRAALPTPQQALRYTYSRSDHFDTAQFDFDHALPFLLDLFSSEKRDRPVVWLGSNAGAADRFAAGLAELGFCQPLLRTLAVDVARSLDDATLIFDFSSDNITPVVHSFLEAVAQERGRLHAGYSPRKFIGVDATLNRAENLFRSFVETVLNPFSSHIRYGYVQQAPFDWTRQMMRGNAGEIVAGKFRERQGQFGVVANGPYRALLPGRYVCRLTVETKPFQSARSVVQWPNFTIHVENEQVAMKVIAPFGTGQRVISVPFQVQSVVDGAFPPIVRIEVIGFGHSALEVSRVVIEQA